MRRRIAFISEHASPLASLGGVDAGGQNVYVSQLATYLAHLGFNIDVFTRCEDAAAKPVQIVSKYIRVIHVKAGPKKYIPKEQILKYMDEFASNMIDFIEQQQITYELTHANFFMSAKVAMILNEILNIDYVITFHALGKIRKLYQKEKDTFPIERLAIEEAAAENAAIIIAECPQDKEDLIHHYNVNPAKIRIVPCGFCPGEFYPINKSFARSFLELPQNENIILQLGRMVPRKGVDNVIEAMARLKFTGRKTRLLIVGGGSDVPDATVCPEISRLQLLAQNLGLGLSVTFAGRKERKLLKYYYSAADVFITTPWYEPFGITPLESMACGTPVIGANVGGIKYSVKHGETGYLVPAKNPAALAARLDVLLASPLLLKKLAANAIKRVHRYFTWLKISRYMAMVYDEILNQKMDKKELYASMPKAQRTSSAQKI